MSSKSRKDLAVSIASCYAETAQVIFARLYSGVLLDEKERWVTDAIAKKKARQIAKLAVIGTREIFDELYGDDYDATIAWVWDKAARVER